MISLSTNPHFVVIGFRAINKIKKNPKLDQNIISEMTGAGLKSQKQTPPDVTLEKHIECSPIINLHIIPHSFKISQTSIS